MEKTNDFDIILEREPSFYTILPANVRYSSELSYFEKVFYSEIVARTNKKGYCWTSNKTFCELYNCSERTITRAIKKLIDLKFLKCSLSNYKGKVYRLLELPNNNTSVPKKKQEPIQKNYTKNKKEVALPSWYDDYKKQLDQNKKQVIQDDHVIPVEELAKELFGE